MTDYQKILMLSRSGMGTNPIARALGYKWETVERTLSKCEEIWGTIHEVPEDLSNEELGKVLNRPNRQPETGYMPLDCETLYKRVKAGARKNDLWIEYTQKAVQSGLKPYKITRFNEILYAYTQKNDLTSRLRKDPGIEGQVDWVGDTGMIIDRVSGEVFPVYIFVMALPYSGYFYCEGFTDTKMNSWLTGHIHAFEFFSGVPYLLVPDNCKTAVIRPASNDEDPIINTQYAALAAHYRTVINPARVRRPKDKASVERHVQIVEDKLLVPMSALDFYSLEEFNRMLHKKLERVLGTSLARRDGSRLSIFTADEKQKLLPLPQNKFETFEEKEAVVARDYHVQYDSAFYSVPAKHIKDKVRVRATASTVIIYTAKGTEIARHNRADHKWQRVTNPDHVPENYSGYSGYTREGFVGQASRYGEKTVEWVTTVLDSFPFEVQGYRTVATALAYARNSIPEAVEHTCDELLKSGVTSSRGFRIFLHRYSGIEASQLVRQTDVNDLFCSHEEVVH